MPVSSSSPEEEDPMEMNSSQSSPMVTNSVPLSKKILGMHSSLLPYSQPSSPLSDICTPPLHRRVNGKPEDSPAACAAWLDAMKASSPPRKTMIMDCLDDPAEVAYTSWMVMHPSALKSFGKIAKCAKNKKIAIFLDYDGTLAPIVNDPDRAFMSNTMRAAVRSVAKCFPTAIISGRSRDKVFDLVGLTDLYYAGSHGMDIIGPCTTGSTLHLDSSNSSNYKDSNIILFQPAGEFLPMIDEVYRALMEKTKGISGAKVENHKFCASVHYRNVEEKNWPVVADSVDEVLKNYPLLRLTHGRKVLEIRPMIEWHKGKAVEFVLESLGLSKGKDMISIYIGDDKTDEDAFKVLLEENRGFGVVVSSIPKETTAAYSLRDPSEVMEFLNCLVKWRKELR